MQVYPLPRWFLDLAVVECIVEDRIQEVLWKVATNLMFAARQEFNSDEMSPRNIRKLGLFESHKGSLCQFRILIASDLDWYLHFVFVCPLNVVSNDSSLLMNLVPLVD